MNHVEINRDLCKSCGLCIEACQHHLLDEGVEMNAKGYHPIDVHDEHKCSACGLCALMCPEGGISVYKEQKVKV
jgi:2-oxoglutarate ferredoxin oxidoreductase subunit delta